MVRVSHAKCVGCGTFCGRRCGFRLAAWAFALASQRCVGYFLLTYALRVSYEEDGVAGCYFEASRAFRVSACARLALKPVAALFERIAACWFGYDGK